jgi:WS/DGAT/MGAT family acyltransferase
MTIATLHRVPRYRQKLAWIPREDKAVWVDDAHFNADYHIRHTSLPRPGTNECLKGLMGRIMAQPLDRSKPLWELWIIEGLEGDRFATILKTHHCMIDGVAGVDLVSRLFSVDPNTNIPKAPAYHPRPLPTGAELWSDEMKRRILQPIQVATSFKTFMRETSDIKSDVEKMSRAVADMLGLKVSPASSTPLNGPLGANRIFEGIKMPLDDLRAIRHTIDCSLNDVVLAIVTGALRKYMLRHQVRPGELDFRVEIPVNVRQAAENQQFGNRVSSWLLRLPLGEKDPLKQLKIIHQATQELKETKHADAVEILHGLLSWLSFDIQNLVKGLMNMIVTNVPGPPHPLYFLGAELLEAYPIAPLLENLGLTIGLFSYNGNMFWGLMADYDRVPDLKNLAALIETSFQKLKRAAEEYEAHKPVPNALDKKRPGNKKATKKKATKRKATKNRTIEKERFVTKATKRSSAEEMSKKINSESSSQ